MKQIMNNDVNVVSEGKEKKGFKFYYNKISLGVLRAEVYGIVAVVGVCAYHAGSNFLL